MVEVYLKTVNDHRFQVLFISLFINHFSFLILYEFNTMMLD